MGTRADFYVGRGEDMEWIGSIAWDGYPHGLVGKGILDAASEEEFRSALLALAADRSDFTAPDKGWPWPWADSFTTDFAYAFDRDRLYVSRETDDHSDWVEAVHFEREEQMDRKIMGELPSCGPLAYPDMTEVQNVDFGSRSGLLILRG
jgi:hypothetical protein